MAAGVDSKMSVSNAVHSSALRVVYSGCVKPLARKEVAGPEKGPVCLRFFGDDVADEDLARSSSSIAAAVSVSA